MKKDNSREKKKIAISDWWWRRLAANSSGWQLETGDISGGWWLGASVGGGAGSVDEFWVRWKMKGPQI